MKSSILAVPIVIEKGVIIQPWRKGHNKNLKTGVTAAPISIGGIRYICCVVNTRNAQKKISPYSIRLFDNTQIRDMLQSNIVHHSTTSTSQPSDTSNANPLTVAKVLQKYLLSNNSQEKDVDDNEDNNSTDTTNENKQYNKYKNMKRTFKLRESELKRMIAESVKGAINELDWKTYANAAKKAREQGRDSRWDFDRATERALDKQYGGHHLVSTDNETYQDFHTYNDDPFSTNYDRAWRPLEGHEDFGSYADVHDSKKPYGNEDVADFVHGRSKYVKGKGWETNESINRKIDRIVSESIRRNIR